MTMEILICDQGSEEWARARMGIPTSSMFHAVLASGKGGGESKTRRTYLLKLAGEILTGEPMENYTNDSMERGKAVEDALRALYVFQTDAEVERVGFIKNGKKGCSPDGLVGKKKMLEIKSTAPHLLIDIHLRQEFPPGHLAQCQGNLWVAEREEIDIAIGYPKMPLYVHTIRRDENYITALEYKVKEFNDELAHVVSQMRRFG